MLLSWNRLRIRGLPVLAPAVLALSALWGCSEPVAEPAVVDSSPDPPDLVRLDSSTSGSVDIQLAEVTAGVLEEELRVSGILKLNENATARVGSFTEGIVLRTLVSVGTYVEKDQVLALIHSHEVHDAEADYWQARAELDSRRSEREYAEQAYRRASRLHELKAGSMQQVQEAETRLKQAEMAVSAAEAEIARIASHFHYLGLEPPGAEDADEGSARQDREAGQPVSIRSPMSGVVVERPVLEGSVVQAGDPLFVISDLSKLWAIGQAPEKLLPSLRTGMTVNVFAEAYPNRPFPARVSYIGDVLDPDTRTVQLRCEIRNPQRRLKSQMYISMVFKVASAEAPLVVPTAAVQELDGKAVVFVPAGENQFRAREIVVGKQTASDTEVLEGLSASEQVVTNGNFVLKSELLRSQVSGEE